jgi:hypothetical protein
VVNKGLQRSDRIRLTIKFLIAVPLTQEPITSLLRQSTAAMSISSSTKGKLPRASEISQGFLGSLAPTMEAAICLPIAKVLNFRSLLKGLVYSPTLTSQRRYRGSTPWVGMEGTFP